MDLSSTQPSLGSSCPKPRRLPCSSIATVKRSGSMPSGFILQINCALKPPCTRCTALWTSRTVDVVRQHVRLTGHVTHLSWNIIRRKTGMSPFLALLKCRSTPVAFMVSRFCGPRGRARIFTDGFVTELKLFEVAEATSGCR